MNETTAGIPPYLRLRLQFQAPRPVRLPPYPGPAWRGALGKALRRLVCVTGVPSCGGCPLLAHCVYQRLFENISQNRQGAITTHAPHPFILHATGGRDSRHRLELTCLNHALADLPTLLLAVRRAAEAGIAGPSSRLDPGPVQHWRQGRWQPLNLEARDPHPPTPAPPGGPVRIHLLSPLRLIHRGRPLREHELTPRRFVHALYARLRKLGQAHGRDTAPYWPPVPEERPFLQRELRWVDLHRYSHRQRRRHPMGGLVGRLTLDLDGLLEAWPALWHGQYLHLGKHTAMGNGAYRIETA